MKKNILKGIVIGTTIFVGVAGFFSCVRERDVDTSISSDQVMGEYIYTNAIDISDDAATKNTGDSLTYYKTRGYCSHITHDWTSNPRTMVIDFGPVNCMCLDGRNRRGKILVSYTGNTYKDSTGMVNISFDEYAVDDYQVFGTIAMGNLGRNTQLQPMYDLNISGKYLNPQILDTLLWNGKQTRIHTVGSTTANYDDDEFEYIGTNNGQDQYKVYYASNIIEPLIKSPSCRFFIKGKVEQQPQGHALRSINYGDGSCDDEATVIFTNKAYGIKL